MISSQSNLTNRNSDADMTCHTNQHTPSQTVYSSSTYDTAVPTAVHTLTHTGGGRITYRQEGVRVWYDMHYRDQNPTYLKQPKPSPAPSTSTLKKIEKQKLPCEHHIFLLFNATTTTSLKSRKKKTMYDDDDVIYSFVTKHHHRKTIYADTNLS